MIKWTHRDDLPGVHAPTLLILERRGLARCRKAKTTVRTFDDVMTWHRRALWCTRWRLTALGRKTVEAHGS